MLKRTLLLAFGCLAACGVLSLLSAASAPGPEMDPQVKKLLEARLETARQGLAEGEKARASGHARFRETLPWSRRVLDCELALAAGKEDRVAAYEKYRTAAKQAEEEAKVQHDAGVIPSTKYLEAKYERQEVETWLAQARLK